MSVTVWVWASALRGAGGILTTWQSGRNVEKRSGMLGFRRLFTYAYLVRNRVLLLPRLGTSSAASLIYMRLFLGACVLPIVQLTAVSMLVKRALAIP